MRWLGSGNYTEVGWAYITYDTTAYTAKVLMIMIEEGKAEEEKCKKRKRKKNKNQPCQTQTARQSHSIEIKRNPSKRLSSAVDITAACSPAMLVQRHTAATVCVHTSMVVFDSPAPSYSQDQAKPNPRCQA